MEVELQVPEGAEAGDTLVVDTGTAEIDVEIPEGLVAGDSFVVMVDADVEGASASTLAREVAEGSAGPGHRRADLSDTSGDSDGSGDDGEAAEPEPRVSASQFSSDEEEEVEDDDDDDDEDAGAADFLRARRSGTSAATEEGVPPGGEGVPQATAPKKRKKKKKKKPKKKKKKKKKKPKLSTAARAPAAPAARRRSVSPRTAAARAPAAGVGRSQSGSMEPQLDGISSSSGGRSGARRASGGGDYASSTASRDRAGASKLSPRARGDPALASDLTARGNFMRFGSASDVDIAAVRHAARTAYSPRSSVEHLADQFLALGGIAVEPRPRVRVSGSPRGGGAGDSVSSEVWSSALGSPGESGVLGDSAASGRQGLLIPHKDRGKHEQLAEAGRQRAQAKAAKQKRDAAKAAKAARSQRAKHARTAKRVTDRLTDKSEYKGIHKYVS